MYSVHLGASPGAARARREELPLPAEVAVPAEAAQAVVTATTVSAVEAVTPARKRYRAVVVRSVAETAIVEFDADETVNLQAVAEEIVAQVPIQNWTRDEENAWAYVDRVEEVGPATDAGPVALDDGTEIVTPEDEEDDEPAVTASARARRRHGRKTRMTADEATMATQDILSAAEQVVMTMPATSAEAAAQSATLQGLVSELDALIATPFTDDAPEADTAASDLMSNTKGVLTDMLLSAQDAEATLKADEDAAAAAAGAI